MAGKSSFLRLLRTLSEFQATSNEATVTKGVMTEMMREHYPAYTPPILDLSDTRQLFLSVPTSKLLRSVINLQLVSSDKIMEIGVSVMKSSLMNSAEHRHSLMRRLILGIVRYTFFEHFCAGENSAEAIQCLGKLRETGIHGMLDMAVEFAPDNESCEQNFDLFMETIESSSSSTSVSCVVVKMTAVFPLHLLERVSDLLRWQQKHSSFRLPWKHHDIPIFSDSSPLYHTSTEPPPLSPEEESGFALGWQRLSKLCQRCAEVSILLVVDAEHTQVQPAIDYLTYSAAMDYNKGDTPLVYNTIQAYLKDSKEKLQLVVRAAEKLQVQMGLKLVRGAYMTRERKLAADLDSQSPIHDTIHETHACYNSCASFLLDKIRDGAGAAILATHNVESGKLAAVKAQELGIGKNGRKLEFAQLYGMADTLSFGLRNAGYQVSKYMPFGPVDKVIPYLVRRAEENRGVLSSSCIDRERMWEELKRRMKAAC